MYSVSVIIACCWGYIYKKIFFKRCTSYLLKYLVSDLSWQQKTSLKSKHSLTTQAVFVALKSLYSPSIIIIIIM